MSAFKRFYLLGFLIFKFYLIMKKMTITIQNEFPELMKFLVEIPQTIPNLENPSINDKILPKLL